MAPTESSILSNFLLLPAPLHTFITLQKFTELFPRPQRSNPQIKLLYRELQYLRGLQTDEIKENIAQEVKIGSRQQKEVARARRKTERYEIEGFDGREIDMEIEVELLYTTDKNETDGMTAMRTDLESTQEQSAHIDQHPARNGPSLHRRRSRDRCYGSRG